MEHCARNKEEMLVWLTSRYLEDRNGSMTLKGTILEFGGWQQGFHFVLFQGFNPRFVGLERTPPPFLIHSAYWSFATPSCI